MPRNHRHKRAPEPQLRHKKTQLRLSDSDATPTYAHVHHANDGGENMAYQLPIPFDLLEHYRPATSGQQARLLARLRIGPITTLNARRELGIMSPSARVNELRSLGYPIKTARISASEENGRHHRQVALYLLELPTEAASLPPSVEA